MLFLGSLLALVSGIANAAAAGIEKHQGMHFGGHHNGFRLLATLARRPLWLVAIVLSALAWVAEASSFALAPVPAVATLRNAGRGLLVVGGSRWLGERFSRLEVVGVVLASAGGVLTAIAAAHAQVAKRPLSNLTEGVVALTCAIAAALVSSLPRLLPNRLPRTSQAAGLAFGVAVGLLFAGTSVFTKEVGDRFALYGTGALKDLIESTGLWLMLGMAVWSQSLIQQAFRRANAATISAANNSVSSLGLIAAGFVLYGEKLPTRGGTALLFIGIAVSIIGTVLLVSPAQAALPGQAAGPGQAATGQAAALRSAPSTDVPHGASAGQTVNETSTTS
jgi:drug/metabolite transporter (DMT)-like permease